MLITELPDKICPKCGGIKYRIYHRKDGSKDYRCRNEDGCLSLAKAKARQTYHENKHIWPSRIPENHAASWNRIYHNNPIYKERQRIYERKSREALDDSYIKKYINRFIKKESGIPLEKLEEDVIIKIRTYLKAYKELKQLNNEENNKKTRRRIAS